MLVVSDFVLTRTRFFFSIRSLCAGARVRACMRAIDIFPKCACTKLAMLLCIYDAMSEGRLYNDDNDDEDDGMDIKIKLRKYSKKNEKNTVKC